MSENPSLMLDRVTKRFDDFTAVTDLSISRRRKNFRPGLDLTGGQDYTIRMICGIIAPDEGAIQLFGRPFRRDA